MLRERKPLGFAKESLFRFNQEVKMTIQTGSSILKRPGTQLGWWSVGLAAVFLAMFVINIMMPLPVSDSPVWEQPFFYFITFLTLCGMAAGVVGLIAVIQKHERSWLVGLATLTGIIVLLSVLVQYLKNHF
jgi:peptidoglycan/LPS O-acetylase OafA/YrhL